MVGLAVAVDVGLVVPVPVGDAVLVESVKDIWQLLIVSAFGTLLGAFGATVVCLN